MSDLIGKQIEHYQIGALLGEGGMGAVYRAHDLKMDRLVAIKIMLANLTNKPQYRQRFAQEAQSVANFNSPAIIKIFSTGTFEQMPYIVMEYIEGGSLINYLKQVQYAGKHMPLEEALTLAAQVAEGLAYAHQRGIIHRDIKPENILLKLRDGNTGPPRQAVLSDFGLAILLKKGEEVATNPFMGSLAYMSPEQCQNLPLDGRSDIYATGIMLYLLTTGQLPFQINAPADIVKHVEEPPLPPRLLNPDLPQAVEDVVLKAIAKKRSERFQTAAEMAFALRQITTEAVLTSDVPQLNTGVVTQWLENKWVTGIKVQDRVDVNKTWTSEGNYRLFVTNQYEESQIYGLVKEEIRIGRSPDNDVVLEDRTVSAHHVVLKRTPAGWQARDLGSTNGTFIEDRKIDFDQDTEWANYEVLRLGPYFLKWQMFGGSNGHGATLPVMVGLSDKKDDKRNGHAAGAVAAAAVVGAAVAGSQLRQEPDPTAVADDAWSTAVSQSDVLKVAVTPEIAEVQPGVEMPLQIAITNKDVTVKEITVNLFDESGRFPTWVRLRQSEVKLLPEESATVTAVVELPPETTMLAGSHPLQIQAITDKGEVQAATISLVLAESESFSVDMHPTNLRENVACRITIRDQSNYSNEFTVMGLDDSDALLFDFDEPQNADLLDFDTHQRRLRVEPGREAYLDFTIRPRKRPWFERNLALPYKVRVRSTETEWQTLTGQVEILPRIRRRTIIIIVLLLLLFALLGYWVISSINAQNQAEQDRIQATADSIAATATAARARADQLLAEANAAQATADALLASGDEESALSAQATADALRGEADAAQALAALTQSQLEEAQQAINNTPTPVPPPTDITIDGQSVSEGQPIGTTVGSFSVVSGESSLVSPVVVAFGKENGRGRLPRAQAVTLSLVSGSGDTDNDAFFIEGTTLKTAAIFDYETQDSYSIRIQADNGAGGVFQKQFTISVIDVDDTPTLQISDVTVDEDAGTAVVVVEMRGDTQSEVTVEYSTSDGTAVEGDDYDAAEDELSWAPGETGEKEIEINIIDDDLNESDETFEVTLSKATIAEIDEGSATVTIVDDEATPTLTIANLTIGEGGGTAEVVVTMAGESSQDVTVTYASGGGTATAGDDYDTASGTVTWEAGETGDQIIEVDIIDDDTHEANETFIITLSNAQNALLEDATATVTITENDDPPTISISDMTIAEDVAGGSASITVLLDGESSLDVTVSYSTEEDTAASDVDFGSAAGTLTWTSGQTGAKTFVVSIVNDGIDETDETFIITLTNPQNATFTNDSAEVTITDDSDVATLTIADVTVNENVGSAQVTVSLTGGSSSGVSVNYATADDPNATEQATAGMDYTQVTAPSPLTWNADETGTRTISIQITDDAIDEAASETFLVVLSGEQNAVLGDTDAVVTITDDDGPPTLSLESDFTVSEGQGTRQIEVNLVGGSSQGVTVEYTVADGVVNGAQIGSDYNVSPASGTLTWQPNEANTSQTISVDIIDDSIDEPDLELFTVSIDNATNADIDTNNDLTNVEIADNDPLPSLSINDVSFSEGSGFFTFTVSLSAVSGRNVSVNYSTADGTAEEPDDYSATNGTINIPAGMQTANIFVSVEEDDIDELNETFNVNLSGPVNADFGDSQGRGTIIDNDPSPEISINSPNWVWEDGGVLQFTLTMSEPSGRQVSIDYETVAGTATPLEDYAHINRTTLNIPAGQTTANITVDILDDPLDEEDYETFTVQLSNPVFLTITNGVGTGSIRDDDNEPSVSIGDASPISVTEGTGPLSYPVTLSQISGRDVYVSYQVNVGLSDATAGQDYITPTVPITIPAYSQSVDIDITLIDDPIDEDDEDLVVDLTGAVNATLGTPTQGTGTIADNDPEPTISIADATPVDEGGGTAVFTVTLSNPSGRDVMVDYSAASGTADIGFDFTLTPDTLTIPEGAQTGTISVNIVDDGTDEVDEDFTVNLANPVNATINVGTGTGVILDNDGPNITIADVDVQESDGTAVFTVLLSTTSVQDISVDYATSNGTAVAPGDYTATSGTINIPAGALSDTVSVNIVNDTNYEPNEIFYLNLSNAVNANLPDPQADGRILRNDPDIDSNDVSVDEGAGTLMFTISLSTTITQDVMVNYATVNGSATAGSDYVATSNTATISAGALSTSVSVTILEDATDEVDEWFGLNLSGAVNGNIADSQGVGTIEDNDGPSITIADLSVNESDGTANFIVSLSASSPQDIQVDYATSDGTAVAPGDYTPNSGTLTILAGSTTGTIPVTIQDDSTQEMSNETFNVTLSNPVDATIGDALAVGTILANDPTLNITNVTVSESVGTAVFSVTLSFATSEDVTFDFATTNGTAVAPGDYTATNGQRTITAGNTTDTISVSIAEDVVDEADETFTVDITNIANTSNGSDAGTGTIVDNDPSPGIDITTVMTVLENVGTATITVTLSTASEQDVFVDYATQDGAAIGGNDGNGNNCDDYVPVNDTLMIPAGSTTGFIQITIHNCGGSEPDEDFFVNLSNAINAIIGNSQGTIWIQEEP